MNENNYIVPVYCTCNCAWLWEWEIGQSHPPLVQLEWAEQSRAADAVCRVSEDGSGRAAVSWRVRVRRHARSSREHTPRNMWVAYECHCAVCAVLCCAVIIIEFGLILVKWHFTTLLLRFYRRSPATSGVRACTDRRQSAPTRGQTYNPPVRTDRHSHPPRLTSSLRWRGTRAMRRRTHVTLESAAVAPAPERPRCTLSSTTTTTSTIVTTTTTNPTWSSYHPLCATALYPPSHPSKGPSSSRTEAYPSSLFTPTPPSTTAPSSKYR